MYPITLLRVIYSSLYVGAFTSFLIKQTENGLVEAVVVLISKMPRMRVDLPDGRRRAKSAALGLAIAGAVAVGYMTLL